MIYRVYVRCYYFDFTDFKEACDFAFKAHNSYVPDGEKDDPRVTIHFLNEEDVKE